MRVESLTFFRFVAATIVVIFHFGKYSTGYSGVLIAASQMVTFFFVLSGFVMALSYFNRNDLDFKTYWWARFSRISPVYFLALFLMLVLIYIQDNELGFRSLLFNLTFTQAWVPLYPLSINPPAWSLSVEAFFYFLFPFILYAIKRYSISIIQFGIISFLFWFLTQTILSSALELGYYSGFPSVSHDLINYFPLTHLCSFMLGITGGMFFCKKTYSDSNLLRSVIITSGAIILVIVIMNNKSEISNLLGFKVALGSSFFAPLFLLFIVVISSCHSHISRMFSLKPLVLLGEASYSMYILQIPVWSFYSLYVSKYLNIEGAYNFYLFFVILTVLSVASFIYLEKPLNKVMRNYFSRH